MKALGFIIISALAVFTLAPTLGYEVQPLYGRTFNLFSLLTSPQAMLSRLTSLTSRFSILQATVDILSSQVTALQTLVNSLQAQVTQLSNAQPKCSSTVLANGGKVIGTHCYTIGTNPTRQFLDSENICIGLGGHLATPNSFTLDSKDFYTALKTKFPAEFATVEAANAGKFWIGYQQASATATGTPGPLIALDGTARQAQSAIFAPAVAVNPAKLAAAIFTPGSNWLALDPVTLLPFICQYPVL